MIMKKFLIYIIYLYLNLVDFAHGQIGSTQKLVSTVGSELGTKDIGHFYILSNNLIQYQMWVRQDLNN